MLSTVDYVLTQIEEPWLLRAALNYAPVRSVVAAAQDASLPQLRALVSALAKDLPAEQRQELELYLTLGAGFFGRMKEKVSSFALKKVLSKVISWFKNIPNQVKNLPTTLKVKVENILRWLKTVLQNPAQQLAKLKEMLRSLMQKIPLVKRLFKDKSKVKAEAKDTIWAKIKEHVKSIISLLKKLASGVLKGPKKLLAGISAAVAWIIAKIKGTPKFVADLYRSIFSKEAKEETGEEKGKT